MASHAGLDDVPKNQISSATPARTSSGIVHTAPSRRLRAIGSLTTTAPDPDRHDRIHGGDIDRREPGAQRHTGDECTDGNPPRLVEQPADVPAGDERDHRRQRNVVQRL